MFSNFRNRWGRQRHVSFGIFNIFRSALLVKPLSLKNFILVCYIIKYVLGMATYMIFSGVFFLIIYLALTQNTIFRIREVQVQGSGYLSNLEILQAAGIDVDTNLLSLSVKKTAQKICKLPWISAATVSRILPRGLLIVIKERRPTWLAITEDEICYLDANMHPFGPVRFDFGLDLPTVSGLFKVDLVRPDEEVLNLLEAVRQLKATLPSDLADSLGGLSEIHCDRIWGLSVVFNNLIATVRMGFSGFNQRWERLAKVLDDLKIRGEFMRATLIDLDSDRRLIVRLGRKLA